MVNHHLNDTTDHSINIYLNSENATITNENFKIFVLNNPIFCSSNKKILLGLSSFSVANSIYNINLNNNIIIIDDTSYALPVGNYDSDSIVETLNALIPLTVIFNEGDNTFNFSSGSSFTISSASTLSKVLGLRDDLPFTGSSLTASHICDLAGTVSINLKLSNLSMDNLNSVGDYDNTIANINNNVNYGDYIFYNSNEIIYHALHDKYIKFLKVELLDQDQKAINFNGSSFVMTLTIHFTYIKEDKKNIDLFKINDEEFQRIESEKQLKQIEEEKKKQRRRKKTTKTRKTIKKKVIKN